MVEKRQEQSDDVVLMTSAANAEANTKYRQLAMGKQLYRYSYKDLAKSTRQHRKKCGCASEQWMRFDSNVSNHVAIKGGPWHDTLDQPELQITARFLSLNLKNKIKKPITKPKLPLITHYEVVKRFEIRAA